jgi:hypothetical protein
MSILIIISAYFITFGIIKERVSDSFELTLNYVCESVNSELKQIHRLTDYLFVNDVIKEAIQRGTEKTEKAIFLNNQVNSIIKQYTISHIFENINSISIYGFNGYYINYAIDYIDIPASIISPNYKDLISGSNGQIVWIGLTSRPLNPNQSNSPIVKG